ncbi:hypothetical protein HO133_007662 [Letharia lupina]|uniref:Uncharacterized protein n=1 Tax=Letharia lupina TaxID=560253 RepID=A0A8H6CR37_9LECA|nr:uncharacterized protein HO133_007662 [Letharia lupina]KAF6227934.1 hypothetical protein HO133_007662 [Letharia lupina]
MNLLSLFSVILLSLLVTITSTQSTNLTTPSNTANFECFPLRVFALRVGLFQNCAAAILTLPQLTAPVSFYHGYRDDIGRLPTTRSHGDCMVTVDLIESSEFSTWTSIGLVATLLMSACADISLNRVYTGGFAKAGNGRGIAVTLQRFEEGLGAGNASGLLTE